MPLRALLHLLGELCDGSPFSIVVGGQPHAGKTELVKYLATIYSGRMRRLVFMRIIRRYITGRLILHSKCVEFFVDD